MAAIQEKTDVKIFILYILRHIGYPLEYGTIVDLLLGGGVISYFDFVECFGELVDAGNILRCDESAEGEYRTGEDFVITDQGRGVADALGSDIVTYIRDKSLKRALQYLSFRRDGTKMDLDIRSLHDQRSEVDFTLTRDGNTFFSLHVISDNEKQTEQIRQTLDNSPESVYKSILAIIAGDAEYLYR